MKNFIYIVLFYTLIFYLFYFDPLIVFGVKFALVWKFLLLFIIGCYLILKKVKIELWISIFFLQAFQQFFNAEIFESFISNFSNAIKILVLPVFYLFFRYYFKNNEKRTIPILILLSIFVIISFIPFVFKMIEPLSIGYDLSKYDSEEFGLIGVFQNPASASIHLTFATIILFYFIRHKKKYDKLFYYIIMLIGIICTYYTYIRTGIFLFIIWGVLFSIKKNGIKSIISLIPLAIIIFITLNYLLDFDPVFKMRVNDTSIYNYSASENQYGSGRIYFIEEGFNIFSEVSLTEEVFGIGQTGLLQKMQEKIGLSLFTHNVFMDKLLSVGILGLLIFIYSWWLLYRKIMRDKNKNFNYFIVSIFITNLFRFSLQPDIYYYLLDVLFALLIVINEKENLLLFYKNK